MNFDIFWGENSRNGKKMQKNSKKKSKKNRKKAKKNSKKSKKILQEKLVQNWEKNK